MKRTYNPASHQRVSAMMIVLINLGTIFHQKAASLIYVLVVSCLTASTVIHRFFKPKIFRPLNSPRLLLLLEICLHQRKGNEYYPTC